MDLDPERHLSDADVDARFAALVERWPDRPSGESGAPDSGPSLESAPAETPSPPVVALFEPPPESLPLWRGSTGPSIEDILEGDLDDDLDDGFTPAPVDLPPAEDLHYWAALTGMIAGPVLIIWVILTHPFYTTWWIGAGIVLFVAGFLLLVFRSPRTNDSNVEDNGARV